mmetsp:Transcript_22167/g.28738  ORF Transcript_22167/g.28738 Transcript_22167/m.28738 type:complete len:350 (+) Transcript_22167:75-1124(+)
MMLAQNQLNSQIFRSKKLNQIEVKFTWEIGDYKILTKFFEKGEELCCPGNSNVPVFNSITKEHESIHFFSVKYIKRSSSPSHHEGWGSIILSNERDEDLHLKCDIRFQNGAEKGLKHLNDETRLKSNESWTLNFFRNDDIDQADSLFIHFDVVIFSSKWQNRRVLEPWSIQHQLQIFLRNSQFSDIQIKCGGTVFQCHKVILAAASDVFQSMFSHNNMSESQNSLLSIGDMQPTTVAQMLEFIYTGETAGVQENALNLFAAADKYNLQSLKMECEEAIFLQIDSQNAAETLLSAHLHGSDFLKNSACEYISANISQLWNTPGVQNLVINYPALLTETLSNESESNDNQN